MADIKQVAERAGVSIATVSHVVNNTRFVTESTKIKVNRAMEELDYQPNSLARSLRNQKTNTVGLIVPILPSDTSNFFFMTVAQGIQHELKKHGYHLLLSTNTTETIEDEKEQIRLFNSKRIDGLIMAPISEEMGYLNELATNYPVVFIDRKASGFDADCVLADGRGGSYEAVRTLIDKGHRSIGMITGGLGITTSDERFEGYRRALEDNGIPFDLAKVKTARSTFESGYDCAREMLSEHKITALFIANNVLTMGAFRYLQEQRIRIPDDLAVIGFDDYDWTRITTPPLTVIRQPSCELGEKAAQVLLKKMKQKNGKSKEYRLDTELILRGSC